MALNKLLRGLVLLSLLIIPFGETAAFTRPASIDTPVVFTDVDLSYDNSCATTTSGAGVCWGLNEQDYLQLGIKAFFEGDEFYPIPVRASGLADNILMISNGEDSSCVITGTGKTLCWGSGYLGDGENYSGSTPIEVIGFDNPSKISVGNSTTCGINSSGTAYCWGWGGAGQMGDGAFEDNALPGLVTIGALNKISVGYNSVCGITTANAAYCWGGDAWGQLGNGTPLTNSAVPVPVTGMGSNMSDISVGGVMACGLTSAGAVKCWGYGGDGALGNGGTANSAVPVQVTGLTSGVVEITTGEYHACARLTDGSMKCWGYNGYAQLGDGTYTNRTTPVSVAGLGAPTIAISAGGNHTCAVLNTGVIKCWGDNYEGQLGIGDNDPDISTSPVEVISTIGSIFGEFTYTGSLPDSSNRSVYITLHPSLNDPPIESYVYDNFYKNSVVDFNFGELEDGTYYVSGFIDMDMSGGGPPDPDEPQGWYDPDEDGIPDPVTIVNGSTLEGIDVILDIADWHFMGTQIEETFAASWQPAGDVNGDGFDDIIIGSPLYDSSLDTDAGMAVVFYGSAEGFDPEAPDWMVEGEQTEQFFGMVSGAGDVNGDGFDDVMVGAYGHNQGRGKVNLYYGSASGLSTSPGWTYFGDQEGQNLGFSLVGAGDLNCDGHYDDIAIGAYLYESGGDADEGRVLVFYGSASGPGASPNWSAEGDQAGAHFGYALNSLGKVNNDSCDDLLIGAPKYDSGEVDEGAAFAWYGSSGGPGAGTPASADWKAESNLASAGFGEYLGTPGDVNGDGYNDVVITARNFDDWENTYIFGGAVFAWLGGSIGINAGVDGFPGNQAWYVSTSIGGGVTAFGYLNGKPADINGDGYGDVIVGFPYSTGEALAYYGSSTGLGSPDNLYTYNWHRNPPGLESYYDCLYGYLPGSMGDINGDGTDDVAVSGPLFMDNVEPTDYSYHNGRIWAYYSHVPKNYLYLPIILH